MKSKKLIFSGVILVAAVIIIRMFLAFIYVPPILMYHSIDEHENTTKLSLSPEGFSRQMEFLYKHKYNVISLEEFATYLRDKKMVPRNTAVLTFDDGHLDNYTNAYPILKKYGIM